jgi:hypothetical protein
MPTLSRRPAPQRERDRLQTRRLRAAELLAAGVHQAEVAHSIQPAAHESGYPRINCSTSSVRRANHPRDSHSLAQRIDVD